jgi:hypothetical protein
MVKKIVTVKDKTRTANVYSDYTPFINFHHTLIIARIHRAGIYKEGRFFKVEP